MTLGAPALLWLLALLPAAALSYVAVQRRRPCYAVRFTNLNLLANVMPRRPAWRRHLPPLLYTLALGGLIVALARPTAAIKLPRQEGTVMLVMDVSGSMDATDVRPSRLQAAVTQAERFVDQLPGHFQVGVVSFSSDAQVLSPPTSDRAVIHRALESMRAQGGTAMGDGIERGLDFARGKPADDVPLAHLPVPTRRTHDRLTASTPPAPSGPPAAGVQGGSGASDSPGVGSGGAGSPTGGSAPSASPPGGSGPANGKPTTMVLLSDGASNAGRVQPETAAQDANGLHVPIYTIALGTPSGLLRTYAGGRAAVIPVPPDPATLQRVSQISGGRFFAAPSDRDLHTIYDNLASRIGFDTRPQDVTPLFIGAAALLLLAAGALSTL
ncbi:MAG: VWA domain-containing protein, partial [Chloroflexota bacterium]|nr:VWA domain-containing protein [Chloroflexota bacterium]